MIDFHTHVLPALDDGAKSVEESLKLLEMLETQGVDTVVLSSHYYGRHRNVKSFLGEYERAYAKLRGAYTGPIRLVRGAECNISTCANSDFSELKALSVGDTRYLLTELSFAKKWSTEFWERIDNLLLAGLVPVIAHVELYPAIRRNPQIACELVGMGCVLQVNCDSVLDKKLSKLTDLLFRHDLVACIGSDTHNTDSRPPKYGDAVETLNRTYGEQITVRLQERMQKILADETIKTDFTPIQRTLFGYR